MTADTEKSGGLECLLVFAPLNRAVRKFLRKKFRVGYAADVGELRTDSSQEMRVSNNGFYVNEGALYFRDGVRRLGRESPMAESVKSATDAVEAFNRGKEYFLMDRQIEIGLTDSIRLPEKSIYVPTSRFNEEEITVWAFGREKNGALNPKKAQTYGDFLSDREIEKMPVWLPAFDYIKERFKEDEQKCFVRQLRVGPLISASASELGGNYWGIGSDHGVLGARYRNLTERFDDLAYLARVNKPPTKVRMTLTEIWYELGLGNPAKSVVLTHDGALRKYKAELLAMPNLMRDVMEYLEKEV